MHRTSRRTFVKGLAATGLLGGLGLWRAPAWALAGPGQQNLLAGDSFDLFIGETPVNLSGSPATAMTINGSLPGPTLRWREGDNVTLRVRNRLAEDTSIHWHGIILPANMDGVPGLSFEGIAPAVSTNTASRSGRTAPTGTTATRGYRSRPGSTAPW
ncbi:copper resistance protein A [Pseudomonas aeruginosa]|nr:copper resistance protein A [Pseudomonas aeruginosa]